MKVYKVSEQAEIPTFATQGSACFDLKACFDNNTTVRVYNPHNREMLLPVSKSNNNSLTLKLQPQFRALVPTGLIFDIPKNHVLKLYIRSSMAFKNGLSLANNVGVVDSDYVDPTYILIYNMGDTPVNIYHGDRIAQGMLEKTFDYAIVERKTAPELKTDRTGGVGSTGVQ